MLDKILIPLEDVPFLGKDNKVRLRYRLKSKDGNETSQWSPVYTINPVTLYGGPQNITTNSDTYSNPLAYSGWTPTSYTDEDNLFINFDTGWVNNKKIIPYKNFDVFVSWNYAESIINIPIQTPVYSSGTITLTTSATHNIAVNQTIFITGTNVYDGTWVAKSGTTGSTLKITSSNLGATTGVGIINIPQKWGYEVSNNGEIESISSPSGYYTLATLTNIDVAKFSINDLIKGKTNDSGGTFGDNLTTTTVTSIIGSKLRISTYDALQRGTSIISGVVSSVSKFSSTEKSYGYAGSSQDNGQIVVKIPKQIYNDKNVIQYQYYLTPKTYPPTLSQDVDSGNWLFLSGELTTNPTIKIGSVDNAIDGGSPS